MKWGDFPVFALLHKILKQSLIRFLNIIILDISIYSRDYISYILFVFYLFFLEFLTL